MEEIVVIKISPKGEIEISTECVVGARCQEITKPFEKALGSATSTEITEDMYKSEVNTNDVATY